MSDLQQAIDKLRSSPYYKELAAYEPPFNPFEIIGVLSKELRHSKMLAWLLRDEANKEFRQKFVAKMVEIATSKELEITFPPPSPDGSKDCRFEKVYVKTEHGFKTRTGEKGRIDVFIKFETLKLVIGIEVKIWADEHSDDQVMKYQNFLDQNYPDYERAVVFLTPTGWEPKTADKDNVYVPVLEMSWGCISEMIGEMQSALEEEDENNFRMQFSRHLERNIVMNEKEEQRIVRKLLSEGDNEETLNKIIDNMPSLQIYSAQWKKIVAEECGVKENSLEVTPFPAKGGIVQELKICIPEWWKAGLPFTLMLHKYQNQNAGVRILLYKNDYPEAKAKLKEFANCSNGVVNDEFPPVPGWDWHSVLTKDGADGEPEHTLIDNIWSEGWKDEAGKRLREQIGKSGGLLEQINKWIETKGANKS